MGVKEELFMEGFKEGFVEGFKIGFNEGYKIGEERINNLVVRNLLAKKTLSVAEIAELCDVRESFVRKVKKESK